MKINMILTKVNPRHIKKIYLPIFSWKTIEVVMIQQINIDTIPSTKFRCL